VTLQLRAPLLIGLVSLCGVGMSACGSGSEPAPAAPDRVEPIAGSPFKRVVLTAQAVQRIGIQTVSVKRVRLGPRRGLGTLIPYAALIYDNQGRSFAYTQPRPLQYVRHAIVIDHIGGDQVFLRSGPSPGTRVVTTGAEELYGAELGVTE
jgi:hypothetical protein